MPWATVNVAQAARQDVDTLPVLAQGAISSALGRDQPAYHATSDVRGITAYNRRHGLDVSFRPDGIAVTTGDARLGLRLQSVGRGSRHEPVPAARIRTRANRIELARGPLTEWYANGPFGLQQGFTLSAPPTAPDGQPLILTLVLAGKLRPAIDQGTGDELALLERDGRVALRYRGLTAVDADGRTLAARLRLDGARLRIEVDDSRARYPVLIDPFIQSAKFTASDGLASDRFGAAVAVSGDTIVVGANQDDIGGNNTQGSAYVFVRPAGGWADAVENAHLFASNGDTSDQFGEAVAIDGNTIVVGAHNADGGGFLNHGAAYVYVRPAGGWSGNRTENAQLIASGTVASLQLGSTVAVSGTTVVAGAPPDSASRGAAYVFTAPGGGWTGTLTESAKLTASDGVSNDVLGSSVAISADVVVAGAPQDDILAAGDDEGSAYVFVRPGVGWNGPQFESAKLTASDGAAAGALDDNLGNAVAVSVDTVAVAAALDDVEGNANQGSVYLYVRPGTGWSGSLTETAHITASTVAAPAAAGDQFGTSIALSGPRLAVGALLGPGTSNPNYGSICVYEKPTGGWASTSVFVERLVPADVVGNNQFGNSVAIDDQTIVAGRPLDSGIASQRGSAYVFVTTSTLTDTDGDGSEDVVDNCRLVANPTQLDANVDGYGNICDADLNNSGVTTASDFNLLRTVLNQSSASSALAAAADMNGSGLVTTGDFLLLRSRLNTPPGPSGLRPNCPPTCP